MPDFQKTHLPRAQAEGFKYLKTLPEVSRFLDTDIFEKIFHTRTEVGRELALIEFSVYAPGIMPHPRARLLDRGLVRENNLLHSRKTIDVINQRIGFFADYLQISLNFHQARPEYHIGQLRHLLENFSDEIPKEWLRGSDGAEYKVKMGWWNPLISTLELANLEAIANAELKAKIAAFIDKYCNCGLTHRGVTKDDIDEANSLIREVIANLETI